jgi:hypothetical protein
MSRLMVTDSGSGTKKRGGENDGAIEGLIQRDERKLTVGTTAKLTADIKPATWLCNAM